MWEPRVQVVHPPSDVAKQRALFGNPLDAAPDGATNCLGRLRLIELSSVCGFHPPGELGGLTAQADMDQRAWRQLLADAFSPTPPSAQPQDLSLAGPEKESPSCAQIAAKVQAADAKRRAATGRPPARGAGHGAGLRHHS